jgi:hypothetical protein
MRPQQSSIVIPKRSNENDGHVQLPKLEGEVSQTPAPTHSHSGRRASCAPISRIARPVCSVSSSARAGTRSSRARARRVRTLDRWWAEARDHTPDSKAPWASITVRLTSSELAASTLARVVVISARGREHSLSYHLD